MIQRIQAIDRRAEKLFEPRSQTDIQFFSFITHLGGVVVVPLCAIATLAYFLAIRDRQLTLEFVIAFGGSFFFATCIQFLFARARPSGSLIEEFGHSFPSRHATASTALYGFIAYATMILTDIRTLSILCASLLSVLVILICVSRVYLRVHHASDVVAGCFIGVAFLSATIYFV